MYSTAAAGLSCITRDLHCGSRALELQHEDLVVPQHVWVSVVQPEIELESPALQDGFLTRSVFLFFNVLIVKNPNMSKHKRKET